MRPLLLITPDFDDSDAKRYVLKRSYADAVLAAGGLPLIAAFDSPVEELLAAAQGLVVSGGAFDIPPETYGEERRPLCGPANEARTRFEWTLLEAALERRMPVLGVCGGMQLLNVMRGGSLVQDIGSELPQALLHEQRTPKSEPSHEIRVEEGSLLDRAMRCSSTCDEGAWEAAPSTATMKVAPAAAAKSATSGSHPSSAEGARPKTPSVNSTHHQAIKALGRDLVVSARAPDGMIEAIEDPSFPFVLGVQWHPELLLETQPWNLGLYRLLVEAARR